MAFARYLIFLGVVLFASLAHAEKRVALVIGNSAYEHVPVLANPKNDAADFSAKLEKLGFDVVVGENLDLIGMRGKIREFVSRVEGAELALFFYAGHGLQVNGANYMAPVDAKLASYNDLDFEAVPMDLVLSAMERNTKTSLIFLDACRDNPLAENLARSLGTRSGAVGRGLAKSEGGIGSLIAFATQPGNVALDGSGRNSPFTSALLKHLGTPGQGVSEDLIMVRREVLDATNGRQVPWDNSSLTGKVVLVPAKEETKQEAKPAEPQKSDNSVELAFWQSVKDSTDPRLLEAYVEQFPQGAFANLARVKIELIKAAAEKETQAKAAAEKLAKEKAEADARAAEEAARKAVEAQKAAVEAEAARKAEAQKLATQDAASKAARQKELEAEAQKAAELAKLREKEAETAYWTSIQSAGGTAPFEAYLSKYPQGQFTDLARIRIDEIIKAQQRVNDQTRIASLEQPKAETETRSLVPEELARETQKELQRIGCLIGPVDGNWGNGSRRALENYAGRQGLKLASLDPALDTLDRLKATTVRVCPLVCGKGQEEKGGRCVAVKKAEPVKKQASVEKKESVKPSSKTPLSGAKVSTNGRVCYECRNSSRGTRNKVCLPAKANNPSEPGFECRRL